MFQTIFILLRRERDKVYKPLDENLVVFIMEKLYNRRGKNERR